MGYALFLSYYLNLNYTQAAQRDWHGPFFLVGAILLAQARPGRVVGGLAGLLTAAGLAFRPQVVLLLPALFLAFDESARRPGESLGRNARPLAFWAVGAVAGMFPCSSPCSAPACSTTSSAVCAWSATAVVTIA